MSTFDKDLRRRVERMLDGRYLVEDLTRLFLGQRERFHARQCFLEVADFVAHGDQRVKGPVTQHVRDFLAVMRVLPFLDEFARTKGPEWSPSVEQRYEALRARLRLRTNAELQRDLGITRAKAESLIGSAIAKDRTGRGLKDKETRVALYLAREIPNRPAFTDDELMDDFIYVLLRNKLLTEEEAPQLLPARTFVTLFAIAHLHGAGIICKDKSEVELTGGFKCAWGAEPLPPERWEMTVAADAWVDGLSYAVHFTIFGTGLIAPDHCDPSLLHPQSGRFVGPVELRDGKLQPLR
ncbi:MAG: hypothetical protein AB1760_01490 [Pseudomonadota bacterium]